MKKIIIPLIIVIISILLWSSYKYFNNKDQQRQVLSVVPEDAIYILKTDNLTDAWNEVQKTNIWQHLIKTKNFEYFQELTRTLNDVLIENKISKYVFDNRPTLMSAHMISANEYDFLYVTDLQSTKNLKKGLSYILSLDKLRKKIKIKYNGVEIYKLINKKDIHSVLYVTTLDNLLLVSFNYGIIKKTLNEKNKKHWLEYPPFSKINNKLEGELIQFFFNYKQLPAFSSVYFKNGKEKTSVLAEQLIISGFDISHDDERIIMEGITIPDSIPSFLSAVSDVKAGKIKAFDIITNRAALYLSLGFKNFNMFYQSFMEQQNKKEKNKIRNNIKKLEKYLDINFQKDMFDWFDQEIALVKIYTGNKQKPEDVLLIIHANNKNEAKQGLNHITERIRKKSPVKFKKYNYNNFEINYLYQKGLFKLILGDLFKKMDKPYFSYIEDYVVFSNSEKVLKKFIDDYIKGNTLSHNPDFMDFKDEWNPKANINVYLQIPKLYNILEQDLDIYGHKELNEKKDFLLSMSRINVQIISNNDIFKTKIIIDHDEKALKKELAEMLANKIDKTVHNKDYEDLQFKISFPDSLHIHEGRYKQLFEDGKTMKTEGDIKNGLPEGIWRTYYPSGKVKSVVNYNDGNVNGKCFFYYDKYPESVKAEMTFEDDLLEGHYSEYWVNGAVKAELEYEDGKLYGEAKYYYPNGRLKIKGKYKKGEKKGKWLFYNQKGKIINKKRYSGLFL